VVNLKIFDAIPSTLADVWTAAYDGTGNEIVDEVAFNKVGKEDPKGVFNFLTDSNDPLYRAIYGEPDKKGKFVYPIKDLTIPYLKPYKGKIGDQYSKYHKETLPEHSAVVTSRLIDAGLNSTLAAILGTFHDCGKKYTGCTNERGEVSFPEHARVGAFFTACWLDEMVPSTQDRKILTAVVYGHMKPKREWHKGTEESFRSEMDYFDELVDFLGNEDEALRVIGLINLMGHCDHGFRKAEDIDRPRIFHGHQVVCTCKLP
jgi:hypothetical protein